MADKNPNGTPDANEFGQLRAYLAQNGFTQTWINNVVGEQVDGRTRAEIVQVIRTGMKVLPKG